MTENAYAILIVGFAIMFLLLGLNFVWYQLSYEILKSKIRRMYAYMKKMYKDYEDGEMEAEELIEHGAPENKKARFEDRAVPPEVQGDKKDDKAAQSNFK